MQLTILPHIGLGEIKFGISRDAIRKKFGEPDRIAEREVPQQDWETWYFNDLKTNFYFPEDLESRLYSISTDNESASLFGNSDLIGLSYEEIVDLFTDKLLSGSECDVYGEDLGWELSFPSLDLQMIFTNGNGPRSSNSVLFFITWCARFDDQGEKVLWPD